MSVRVTFASGGWYFSVAPLPRNKGYIALAKSEPFTTFDPIREQPMPYRELAATADEAIMNITKRVFQLAQVDAIIEWRRVQGQL